MKPLNEKLYYYVTSMWYESKCKDKNKIKKIIQEEIKSNPNLELKRLKLHILRRCKSEL